MMYMAIKVEKQLKRKGNARLDDYLGSSQGCKLNFRIEDNTQIKSITVSKVIEPLYVKNKLQQQKKKEEIMFNRNINEKLSILSVKDLGKCNKMSK